jgi:hypothetical protein
LAETAVNVDLESGLMVVHVRDATVAEVLSELGKIRAVRYRAAVDLSQLKVSGIYKGTIDKVIFRLLEDQNFVLSVSDERIDVFVHGRIGPKIGASVGATSAGQVVDSAIVMSITKQEDITNVLTPLSAVANTPFEAPRRVSARRGTGLKSMLESLARGQLIKVAPSPPPEASPDMAALTLRARAQLETLMKALERAKP